MTHPTDMGSGRRPVLQQLRDRGDDALRVRFQGDVLLAAAHEVLDLAHARLKFVRARHQCDAEPAAVGVLQLLSKFLGVRIDLNANARARIAAASFR